MERSFISRHWKQRQQENLFPKQQKQQKHLKTILGEGAAEKMFKGYDQGERVAATQKLTRLNNAQVKEYGEAASKGLFA